LDPTATPTPADWSTITDAPVFSFGQYSIELGGAVTTLQSADQIQITLGGDVLFASDSADLSPDAQAALKAAVVHLDGYAGGTINIVGHTDNIDTEAYNQDLSERRAQSVVRALQTMIDTSKFTLVASGKGETEPVAPNDSDANRQLNRRVVLTLTSEVTTPTQVQTTGDLPPFTDGPVGTGADGVDFTSPGRTFKVTAPAAVQIGNSLLVTIQVTATDNVTNSYFGFPLNAVFSYRDNAFYPQYSLATYLRAGTSAVYPYDYQRTVSTGGTEQWAPLADLDTLTTPLNGGQTVTYVGLYPAITGTPTIAIQFSTVGTAFRLTDIPITSAG
jgi:outer membrane protein OmpA-like peptidoglycan-associated protein